MAKLELRMGYSERTRDMRHEKMSKYLFLDEEMLYYLAWVPIRNNRCFAFT